MHLDFGIDKAPSPSGYPSISLWADEEGVRELGRVLAGALERGRPPEGGCSAEALLPDGAGGTTYLKVWIEGSDP